MNKIIIQSIALGLLSFLAGCSGEESQIHKHSVATIQPRPVADEIVKSFSGRIEEAREINLGFKTPGQIEEIYVKEGDYVKQGDLIARLDDNDYQLGVDALEVQHSQLSREIERMKQLVEAKSLSENDYEKAVAGWEQLGIQLQNNRNQLSYTRLEAPMSGYIQNVNYEPAEMVDAGMPVVTLLDTHRMEVVADIPIEVYLQRDHITKISCNSSATGHDNIPMQLSSITPKADGNQLYRMKLNFTNVEDSRRLTAGMNIEISLAIADNDTAHAPLVAYTVPMHAVFNDSGQDFVWVVAPDSVVHKTAVTLGGIADDGNIIVTDGISSDQQVVKAGVEYLQDNEKVNILPAAAETNVGNIL